MTTLTTPQFRNLLYKSNAQAKSIDYYVAEARSHTDEHKRIIIYTYGAILRSEIATDYLIKGLFAIECSKYYRFAIKKAAKDTREQYNKYARIIADICKDENLLDSLDHYKEVYTAKLKRHLDVMFYSLLQALDDQGAIESKALALLLMADTLIVIADGRMKVDTNDSIYGRAVRQLSYLSLANIRSSLGALTSRIGDLSGKTLDINTDRTKAALHALGEALRNYNHILHTIEEK